MEGLTGEDKVSKITEMKGKMLASEAGGGGGGGLKDAKLGKKTELLGGAKGILGSKKAKGKMTMLPGVTGSSTFNALFQPGLGIEDKKAHDKYSALNKAKKGGYLEKKNLGKQRVQTVKETTLGGITKPAIRRLARRGGVKRISKAIYDEVRQELQRFLEMTLRDATTYCEHSKRKTVTPLDIVYALKRKGRDLYGYGV